MGVFSKLAGKAIKRGTRSGLMGSGRTTSLRTLDEMPTSEATLKRREEGKTLFGTPQQRMEEPPSIIEETPPTTDMPPITAAPLVDDAKTARMMMLQGKPIESAPPIAPIETPQIRAEMDVVPPVRAEMDELVPSAQTESIEYIPASPAKSIMMKEGESLQYADPLEVRSLVIPDKSDYLKKFGNPSTALKKDNLPENIIKDSDNNPIVVYRGLINYKDETVESMLSGQSRENYSSFFTDNPDMAATYAGAEGGFLTPFFIKPKRIIEFPVHEGKHGRLFDKFEFDIRAKQLKKGEILRAHNVIDTGPRRFEASDPLNKSVTGSDVYAINDTDMLVNAYSKRNVREEMDKLVPSEPEYLYHATLTKNLPRIRKEGLSPLQPSLYKKAGTGQRYQEKPAIFAFSDPEKATRWAQRMIAQGGKESRSGEFIPGEVSIIKIKREKGWKPDPSGDPDLLEKGETRSFQFEGRLMPEELGQDFNVTKEAPKIKDADLFAKRISSSKGGGGDGDGIDFAGQRFSKASDVDESKDALELADIETVQKGDFKTPRKKDLQKAARQLAEGNITGKQYRQIAKEQSPIEPFTEVPEPATLEKIAAVLKGEGGNGIKKLLNGIIGFNRNIEQGAKVLSRLDIPAYNNFNTWIATVTHKGKSMYGSTAVLKNVEFKPHTTPSLKIAKGEGGKEPFATMSGNWQNMSSGDIRKFVEDNDILEKSLDDANEEWIQVGFNPERHGFFYHKSGKHKGRPIFKADEMIQIGALVLARNPEKPSFTQLKKLKVKGVNAIFNKGGVVDMRNGGRVGAAVVAASLMANGGQTFGGIKYNPDLLRGTEDDSSIIDYATPEEQEFDPEASKEMDALLAKRYAKEQPAASESKPTPDTFKGMYEKHLKKTEGDVWHKDTKDILTSPYGLRADLHNDALEKMRVDSGAETIQQIPKQNLLQYAVEMLHKAGNQYSTNNKTRGFYSALSDNSKFLLSNATYNTGQVFSELAKSLSVYEKNKNVKTLSSVVKETRRYSGKDAEGNKIHTKGADNRAVRDLVAAGIIDPDNKTHMKIVWNFLPKTDIGRKRTS